MERDRVYTCGTRVTLGRRRGLISRSLEFNRFPVAGQGFHSSFGRGRRNL